MSRHTALAKHHFRVSSLAAQAMRIRQMGKFEKVRYVNCTCGCRKRISEQQWKQHWRLKRAVARERRLAQASCADHPSSEGDSGTDQHEGEAEQQVAARRDASTPEDEAAEEPESESEVRDGENGNGKRHKTAQPGPSHFLLFADVGGIAFRNLVCCQILPRLVSISAFCSALICSLSLSLSASRHSAASRGRVSQAALPAPCVKERPL